MYFLKQLTRQIFMNSQVAFRIPNRQEGVHLITVTSCIFFFRFAKVSRSDTSSDFSIFSDFETRSFKLVKLYNKREYSF